MSVSTPTSPCAKSTSHTPPPHGHPRRFADDHCTSRHLQHHVLGRALSHNPAPATARVQPTTAASSSSSSSAVPLTCRPTSCIPARPPRHPFSAPAASKNGTTNNNGSSPKAGSSFLAVPIPPSSAAAVASSSSSNRLMLPTSSIHGLASQHHNGSMVQKHSAVMMNRRVIGGGAPARRASDGTFPHPSSAAARSRSHELQHQMSKLSVRPSLPKSSSALNTRTVRHKSLEADVTENAGGERSDSAASVPVDEAVQLLEEKVVSLQRSIKALHMQKQAVESRCHMLESHNTRLMRTLALAPQETASPSARAVRSGGSPSLRPKNSFANNPSSFSSADYLSLTRHEEKNNNNGTSAGGSGVAGDTTPMTPKRSVDPEAGAEIERLKLENGLLKQEVEMQQKWLNKYKEKELREGGETTEPTIDGLCTPRTLDEYSEMRTERDAALREIEKLKSQLAFKTQEFEDLKMQRQQEIAERDNAIRLLEDENIDLREKYNKKVDDTNKAEKGLEMIQEKFEAIIVEKHYTEKTLNSLRDEYNRLFLQRQHFK